MIIKNADALKSWLVVVLEPLCDADSSALARYVLALLKKDKPGKELKKLMIEQLDVFLAEETTPFVERLFDAINSEEYLSDKLGKGRNSKLECVLDTSQDDGKQALLADNPPKITQNFACVEEVETPPPEEIAGVESLSDGNKNLEATPEFLTYTATVKTNINSHVRSVSPPLRTNADKENQPRESRRRASLHSRSRSRTRSLSNERLNRRSRSRDRRINEREKMQRQFRNKSPPATDLRHGFFHEKRRGGNDRKRIANNSNITCSEDRCPRFGGNGGDGSSRRNQQNHSKSRSRSPSQERRNKGSPNISRSVRLSPESRNAHSLNQHEKEKRQRCRDFDEKGYCVRGETCPWDHGINPVVFEDINNTTLIGMSLPEYNPDAPDLWMRSTSGAMVGVATTSVMTSSPAEVRGVNPPGINPFTGVARGSGILSASGVSAAVGFPPLGCAAEKSDNNGAMLTGDYSHNTNKSPAFRVDRQILSFPFNATSVSAPLQRELIPIPVVDPSHHGSGGDINKIQPSKRRFGLEDSVVIADGPTKRKLPLNSRLGPRLPSLQNNCSLELRKIPRGLNTIAHLNNHFAKFGKIVNIQISYDGDPEAAIVTFSSHAEANVAYRSTEAVLNNRFIKVFWHNQESVLLINENATISIGAPRKNNQYHLNNIPAIATPASDSAKISNNIVVNQCTMSPCISGNSSNITDAPNSTNITMPIPAHVPPTSLRMKNNVTRVISNAIIRKKQEEQAKAVVHLANGLRKRKQELLQSYVKQMKSALDLVERCDQNDPQRTKTLQTIKVLQETIDKLRKEIAAEQEQIQAHMQNQNPPQLKKTKEQQKKELLDIELELIAQQQEGNDTTVIQKRLEELQRSLGITPGSGLAGIIPTQLPSISGKAAHLTSSRTNLRARPFFPEGPTRVDRRPKTIVVTGFTTEESDSVLGQFKHFGEITKHDMDKEIPQLILSYASRVNAEQAVLRGNTFKDKRLQITWAPVVATTLSESSSLATDKLSKLEGNSKTPGHHKLSASVNTSDKPCNDSEVSVDTLPELRLEDEEEDDESEERSWRR